MFSPYATPQFDLRTMFLYATPHPFPFHPHPHPTQPPSPCSGLSVHSGLVESASDGLDHADGLPRRASRGGVGGRVGGGSSVVSAAPSCYGSVAGSTILAHAEEVPQDGAAIEYEATDRL